MNRQTREKTRADALDLLDNSAGIKVSWTDRAGTFTKAGEDRYAVPYLSVPYLSKGRAELAW